jgi:Tol biopolymer transport system component
MQRTLPGLALAAAGLVLAGSSVGRSAPTQITGLSGHIVFTRAGGPYGDETLFVANADGSAERRISKLNSTCCPWATPNGSRLDFAGGAANRVTTVTANLDGSHRRLLPLPKGTLNLGSGPLTKDGAIIAREGFDDAHPASAGIYLTRSNDGSVVRRVTKTHFIPGDFSPDGKRLVLFKPSSAADPLPGSLWVVETDGAGLRRLTPTRILVECCFNYRWSPDGKKILFGDSAGLLWTIAPDGSNLTRVFKDANGRYAATPTWSPDGSLILFALDPTPDPFGGNDFKREPVWVSG